MPSDDNSLVEILTDMLRSALAWEASGETSLIRTNSLAPGDSIEDTSEETLKIPNQGGEDDEATDNSESADRSSPHI